MPKYLKTGLRRLAVWLMLMHAALVPAVAEAQPPELWEPVGVDMDTAAAYVGEISTIGVHDAAVVPVMEELYFAQDGVVAEVCAVIGQKVSEGEVLIRLDQEALDERLEALEAEIEKLRTNGAFEDELGGIDLSILQVELQALLSRSPLDEDAVALKRLEIEELELNLEYASDLRRMKLEQLEAELGKLRAQARENVLTAPFDGTIVYGAGLINGSRVRAYSPVLYVVDESRLMIETEYISESQMKYCHDLYVLAGEKRYEVAPVPVDEAEYNSALLAGETVLTQFEVLNPDEALKAGMYAAVCMERNYASDALLIPSNALYMDGTGKYVYVVEDGERVRRKVSTGISNNWLTQIKEGLEEGEVVYVKE